jgi:hypothetical protein
MSKKLLLLQDIVCNYHPRFYNDSKRKKWALESPEDFNVERLVEQSFAAVGGYKFIDADHCDFEDGTDSKTASIRLNPKIEGGNTHTGEISGVTTAGGSLKIGALRTVIYNPHTNSLMYYFLPKSLWENNITYHPTSGIGKIVYSYHRPTDYIAKFSGYQCRSFEELAKAK